MPVSVLTEDDLKALENKVDTLSSRVDDAVAAATGALDVSGGNFARIEGLDDRLTKLEVPPVVDPPPPPPPDPDTYVPDFDLAPNEGKFVGSPVSSLGASLERPNELTRGRGWPAAHVDTWNGMGWDKITKTAWIFGGGHNDGGSNAVMTVNVATNNLKVIKQAFELQHDLPDGSRSVCPRPRDFGDDKGPDSRHTYDGVVFRQKDRCFYIVGGFPYTCNAAIGGRPVDIQKIDAQGNWTIVRANIRDDMGRVSNGGSSSYAADELSNGDIAIIAKGYCRAYDPDTDTYKDNGGPGNRLDLGAYSQTVPMGDGAFFVYDYHRNYRIVRYRWVEEKGIWGISIGQVLGKLPVGFAYVSCATFCKGWVVGWNGNNRLFYYNPESNVMRVADYGFRDKGVSNKMTASKMQVLGDDHIMAMPRWADPVFVFRMPTDPMTVTQDPAEQPKDLQKLVDAASKGDVIELERGTYNGAVIDKDYITLKGHQEGTAIISFASDLSKGIGGMKAAVLAIANELTLEDIDIRPGRYGSPQAACVRVAPAQKKGEGGQPDYYVRHKGLTIKGGAIQNCHNGVLTDPWAMGHVKLTSVNFRNLGNDDGLMHAIYYGSAGTNYKGVHDQDTEILHAAADSILEVNNCTFDEIVEGGHAIKTGALYTRIRGGTVNMGQFNSSRPVDCYAGGHLDIDGLIINQVHPLANKESIAYLMEAFQRRHTEHSVRIVNCDANGENMRTFFDYRRYATPAGVVPEAAQLQAYNDITGYVQVVSGR